MSNGTGKLGRDLEILGESLRPNEDSLVRQRDLAFLIGYLMFSAACAAPLVLPGVSKTLQVVMGLLLLLAFLFISRATVRRLRTLGEFEQLILYRSMATGGLIAVWFVLAAGVLAVAFGFDKLFLIMALGPPELWLCTALFARGAETAYRRPMADSR